MQLLSSVQVSGAWSYVRTLRFLCALQSLPPCRARDVALGFCGACAELPAAMGQPWADVAGGRRLVCHPCLDCAPAGPVHGLAAHAHRHARGAGARFAGRGRAGAAGLFGPPGRDRLGPLHSREAVRIQRNGLRCFVPPRQRLPCNPSRPGFKSQPGGVTPRLGDQRLSRSACLPGPQLRTDVLVRAARLEEAVNVFLDAVLTAVEDLVEVPVYFVEGLSIEDAPSQTIEGAWPRPALPRPLFPPLSSTPLFP